LAMLAKGSVAILPAVLLGIAWWRRGKLIQGDIIRTAPFFVVAIVLAAINVWFQTHGSGTVIRIATWPQRILGAVSIGWFYLGKALLPLNLSFVYSKWDIQTGDVRWWLPLVAACVITLSLIWHRRDRYARSILFAWGFFWVALLPVLG